MFNALIADSHPVTHAGLHTLRADAPDTKFMIVSDHGEEVTLRAYVDAGADGVLRTG